jgi:broad specificity phosphatase PhoE/GNAT superfamily N-acetyltransferase
MTMSGSRLVLLRHGESVSSVERTIGGPLSCTGLSELGHRQAAALAARLADDDTLTDAILVSSMYPRAVQTAQAVADAWSSRRGASVSFERIGDLGEQFPGETCDGMTFEEYVERFGSASWAANPYAAGFPGGETVATFQHRVADAVMAVVASAAGHSVVMACHGGVIDRIMRLLLHSPPTGLFELHTMNCSITEFSQVVGSEATWRLHRYNDTAHLAGLPSATVRAADQQPSASQMALEPIDASNIDQVVALSSSTGVPVAAAYARTVVHGDQMWSRAAVVNGRVVGFVALAASGAATAPAPAADGRFIWQLVVDRSRERTGFGRRIVELTRVSFPGVPLYLTWPVGDVHVARFAKSLGFEASGPNGDSVLARLDPA